MNCLYFRALVLFKLLLLERKVLLFQSPVVDLTSFLLTLLSLHPGMLEHGLDESACVVPLDTPPLSLSPDCNQEISEGALEAEAVINLYQIIDSALLPNHISLIFYTYA